MIMVKIRSSGVFKREKEDAYLCDAVDAEDPEEELQRDIRGLKR